MTRRLFKISSVSVRRNIAPISNIHFAAGSPKELACSLAQMAFLLAQFPDVLLDLSPACRQREPGLWRAGRALSFPQPEKARRRLDHLFAHHKIVTFAIHHKQFSGIRVTPNVYTSPREIDVFVDSLRDVLAKGLS